jgi:hypothetical protein
MTISLIVALLMLAGGCSGRSAEPTSPRAAEPRPAPTTYEVHEWGLVRGTSRDGVVLSGPHADAPAVPVAKPILYFHREGEGALSIDVTVEIPRGRVVEHWPLTDGGGPRIAWRGVRVERGACRGARYPSATEVPCSGLTDGCEAAELGTVETDDADCLETSDGARWNHLFYRGEVEGTPDLALRLEPTPDGRLRVTHAGASPIVGRLLRLHHDGSGRTDAALVADPPPPGSTVVLEAPSGSVADAATALEESLRAAGLTDAEARAFRRAWDAAMFGAGPVAAVAPAGTIPAAESPVAGASPTRASWTSVIFVLPPPAADRLAILRFTPPPRAVRRAIVAWVDEARAP